ncbi:MAG: potassium transporter Kup [Bacteroidia bacterium]|nr:potassium transporter Kup [Bacteroidia bacterium]
MEERIQNRKRLFTLSFAALGVVFGDIGTSPLYAVRECFYGDFAIEPTPFNVMGAISLIFWALLVVISFKYLILVLRADNEGEGGILALMDLVIPRKKNTRRTVILAFGLFGAALLYGDGMITPAISVLGAMEGLTVATPVFEPYVVVFTVVILFGLFWFQKKGTQGVGMVFGPLILIWFLALAVWGVRSVLEHPEILKAANPACAIDFFRHHHWHGIIVLGAVFLVVTGGEALYADIGHFGKKPIQLAWFAIVLPCLLINYFGQGALLLGNKALAVNPFYHMMPHWALYPMVVLAAMATVIASQAVISGAFSLTLQAMQLGFLPRIRVVHTSEEEKGQIYIPLMNWILFLATCSLVVSFQSSSRLAAAYGVAVTTTMVITTLLAFLAMRKLWHWNPVLAVLVSLPLLLVDISFFASSIHKVPEGGWFPLLVAGLVYFLMMTWNRGRRILSIQLSRMTEPLGVFLKHFDPAKHTQVSGTAVYCTGNPNGTPPALIHNLQHNKVIHEAVLILSVIFHPRPWVPAGNRIELKKLDHGFYQVVVNYGYMDRKDIPAALELVRSQGAEIIRGDVAYFLGRETIISSGKKGMSAWRETIFAFLSRNSQRATKFFHLPSDQVFEVGTHIEL